MPKDKDHLRYQNPLYGTWRWIRYRTSTGVVERWSDFWQFLADVGDRPSRAHTIRRIRESESYGPDNFYWKHRLASSASAKDYQKAWRKAHPRQARNSDLRKHFDITIDDYESLLKSQHGKCAICGSSDNGRFANLAVDHCHDSKVIRGLLCSKCNTGIGLFLDDPELLLKAIEYLLKSKPVLRLVA